MRKRSKKVIKGSNSIFEGRYKFDFSADGKHRTSQQMASKIFTTDMIY
jgi:hypothetical protein